MNALLAIRSYRVALFHLLWSPEADNTEMAKHPMSVNARALAAMATLVGGAAVLVWARM